ncbi:MAG: M28 family peptidase [Bacteroidota bacterium]
MRNKIIFLSLILGFLIYACGSSEKQTNNSLKTSGLQIDIPDFSADSAYAYVAKQLSFGPRVPGSDAHAQCAAWLESTLKKYTNTVEVQAFKAKAYNGKVLRGKNLIASFRPESRKRIFLCAHWDARPFADHDPDPARHNTPIDGANDGASGVGVLIEMARQFSIQNPAVGVDIILFDLEDYGPPQDEQGHGSEDYWGLGSQFWANNPHKSNYHARYGILLDMVGVKNATFLKEGYSMMYAPSKVKKVWDAADTMGYGDYFVNEKGGYITDDHYYINKIMNIPTINIIHLDSESANGSFFDYWHTVQDKLEHVDKQSLQVVGNVMMNVVYLEKG